MSVKVKFSAKKRKVSDRMALQGSNIEIVKYNKNCYHIKNFLSVYEQIQLYEGILYSQSKCKPSELKNKNKYSTMLMRINLMIKLNGTISRVQI